MHVLVTGGAGFIGSHLCDRLVQRGDKVWCVDNLYLGQRRNIVHLEGNGAFRFVEADVLDRAALDALFAEHKFEAIFHLAANSDIAAGNSDAELDLRLNQLTTLEVLEAMRRHGVKRLFFASTSAVFGEAQGDLHEDFGPLQPISFYGASKLGAEGYTSVYCNQHGIRTVILRFPNVIGERSTHGVIFDFLRKLKANPAELEVLGDGNQQKPYLYVGDLVDAILVAWDKATAPFSVFHASGIDSTSVREIAEIVVAAAGRPDTKLRFTGGDRGWRGDVPKFSYDISRLMALGWQHQNGDQCRQQPNRQETVAPAERRRRPGQRRGPRRHSTDAVRFAVERILANGF